MGNLTLTEWGIIAVGLWLVIALVLVWILVRWGDHTPIDERPEDDNDDRYHDDAGRW